MKSARKRPTAAKLRSWRVSVITKRGQYLGTVEATNEQAAEAASVAEFDLGDEQRGHSSCRSGTSVVTADARWGSPGADHQGGAASAGRDALRLM